MGLAAKFPFLTDAIHRYCFASAGENWAWPGNQSLASIENDAADGLRKLFHAKYVNLKPISGINCMAVALSALAERDGTIFSISATDGGHNSTRFLAERLGLINIPLPYRHGHRGIDVDRLASLASTVRGPKLVYLDQFMCLFPHDLSTLREAVGPETHIHYDGSHVLGLIAGGQFQDPLSEGADSLAGSTHKTFPGPHKGILLTNSDRIRRRFDEHASYWVSHHHPADVAALAIAVTNFRDSGREYATRVVRNAQHLGAYLSERGFTVCAADLGFTRCHQLWIDIAPLMEPERASEILLSAGIVINAIEIPYLETEFGLRLGVQEVTRLGMNVDEMRYLAQVFERLLIRREDPHVVALDVRAFRQAHSLVDENKIVETILEMIMRREDNL
jgi:glycine/serine hydroxymethyltransferase